MRLICEKCIRECDFPCAALDTLSKVYSDLKTESKLEIIKSLRKELSLIDYEVADDLRELGEKIISSMPELYIIRDYDIKIGFIRSYEAKRDKGRQVNADCRKVNSIYTAYLPFDFIVTFYEPNTYYMTENQKKILMLHELRHIGIGERGLRLEPHDIEDFKDIIERFGIEWNGFDQEVPDILAGGDNEKENTKQKGKKKQGMATSRKTNKNG
ncbi:putative metallopeptidase [Candidatus Desulfosporosinus nitrosoreducens]|uniref:putative metallopeptidase n=1 Tax=Candidatus Desulfosporosinus nitrosoreducens TaxID=3401928 RepID=UPI00280B692F|nr:putative metallopeptidase [Desulfosporosinus sp. PR]